MNRDTIAAFILWAAMTAAGEFLVIGTDLFHYPLAAADEALMVDRAFLTLTIMAVPVFTFVVSVLVYSMLRFRSSGPTQDGPPVFIHRPWVRFWFVWTASLTVLVIIFPGITGIRELRHHATDRPVDLVVEVQGTRWFWTVTYPEQGVTTKEELVLPVGQNVRFDVTAVDVLHAFWVPAFRMKIDAVPGMVTHVSATPNEIGDFSQDPQMRLQCAELCGVAHNAMQLPVRVVTEAEFETWVAQQVRQARKQ